MSAHPDAIAQKVHDVYEKLPAKRKPMVKDNGVHEWVPLAGIVAQRGAKIECLALATGMKCLPASTVAAAGGVGLHDSHAEMLAIRAFNRFLLDECQRLAANVAESFLVERVRGNEPDERPFRLVDGVELYMYCSEAPCGDASMELTMASQHDSTPWATPDAHNALAVDGALAGRGFFSELGVVRRKPGRGDAPPTLSKSCSDKLSLRQCTSLLSSVTSLFIDPRGAYIGRLILPASQHAAGACKRAFSGQGRMAPIADRAWPGGYSFTPFRIESTEQVFTYSKEAVKSRASTISASNVAAIWSRSGIEESVVGGVIQGRKAFNRRGASSVSRLQLWMAANDLAHSLGGAHGLLSDLSSDTYCQIKDCPALAARRHVKADVLNSALKGWIRNAEGSAFRLLHEWKETGLQSS